MILDKDWYEKGRYEIIKPSKELLMELRRLDMEYYKILAKLEEYRDYD